MGRDRGHAHRHDGPFAGRERPDGAEELIGSPAIHDAQDGPTALGQAQGPLSPVLRLLLALDQPAPDKAVDQAAGGRWRSTDLLGQLAHGHRAAIRQDVEGGQLGEPETQLPELAGESDDQLAPERPAHGHALTELPDVL